MKTIFSLLGIVMCSLVAVQCTNAQSAAQSPDNPHYSHTDKTPVKLSDAEWKKILTKDEFYIAREKGTERAFTGKNWDNHDVGTYYCAACGNALFDSKTKFESGTGWPSFYQPIDKAAISLQVDGDGSRTEVECARCTAHLGHVFYDGPKPTGLRYCMDGNIMDFEKTK